MFGSTPEQKLLKAAKKNDAKAVEKWLAAGARVNAYYTEDGWTALIYAARYDNTALARILIEKGADVTCKNKQKDSALAWAAYHGNIDLARLLIEKGAPVNAPFSNGSTALLIAADWGHTSTVRLLIEKGANLNHTTNAGETALDRARKFGCSETVALLKEALAPQRRAEEEKRQAEEQARLEAEEKARQPTQSWIVMGDDSLACVKTCPEAGLKLTEIFNFTARERLIISENLQSGVQSPLPPVSFDTLEETVLQRAFDAFRERGGRADEGHVFKHRRLVKNTPLSGRA